MKFKIGDKVKIKILSEKEFDNIKFSIDWDNIPYKKYKTYRLEIYNENKIYEIKKIIRIKSSYWYNIINISMAVIEEELILYNNFKQKLKFVKELL